ncbi:TetR/AcrR family transcriptional regulator [Sanguibacter sp. A247]|uniref:TetR/AcrR family transcriptional regulator n=1 Tax=unclassified Sanguibacter TaxID=2645534 RepID=UPI003FD6DD3F
MTASLRDLKKAATAHDLAATALALVRERGYDAVTIDQIAERAGYSRRTFANHFGGKAEAVVDGFLERVRPEAIDETSAPHSFSDLVDGTEAFISALCEGPALDDIRDFVVIAREHPVVESTAHARMQAFRGSATLQLLAHRFGETRSTLYISAVVGLLGGALHVLHDELGEPCGPPDLTPRVRARLRDLITEAFGYLRHGFVPGPRAEADPAP